MFYAGAVVPASGKAVFCPACNASNADTNNYCERCGAALPATVCGCGYRNPATARYCGACGKEATAWRGAASGTIRGERKQVTVLFADIAGSTQLISALDPEDAANLLLPAVASLCRSVERFSGGVLRTQGDGVMALFGAPRATDRHALLACGAALDMQQTLSRQSAPLQIRVGLHSGEVVSRGGDAEFEHDAYGAVVHLASRIEQLAEPGSIYLSGECRRLVHSYCDTRPLGRHAIRGFAESIEIHRLLGMRPAVASDHFRSATLTRFVNRDVELATLQRALQESAHGRPRVIAISGGPGMGKSRLCYEFAELTRARRIPVFEARALPYGQATPFQPVLEFLRSLFHLSLSDTPVGARRRVADFLLGLDAAFERDLALIEDFLGIAEKAQRQKLDPQTRSARLHDFFRRLVRRAGESPCLMVVQDLHWLDASSEEFLDTLVASLPGTRIMLLVNFRPSYMARWLSRPYCERLELVDLDAEHAGAMVRDLVGEAAELNDIRRRIVERSAGNPFFAEELVRSLATSGALVGDSGKYQAGSDGPVQLPGTVQSVISERVDTLPAAEKTILQIAAIVGKEFSNGIIELVSGLAPDRVRAALDHLSAVALIQPSQSNVLPSYAFRHPLTHEVAYSTQLRARRAELHAAVAQAMERLYKERLDEFAALLAEHWEEAGRLPEAATYTQRAALWLGTTDSAQALKHWRKLRELLQSQPRSAATDLMRMIANGQILNFGWREGVTAAEAQPLADEALGWAHESGNVFAQTLLLAAYGRILAASGAADEYIVRVKGALSLGAAAPGEAAMLNAMLSQAYSIAGLFKEAWSANSAALDGARSIDSFTSQFFGFNVEYWILCLRAQILLNLGQLDEAEAMLTARLADTAREQSPVVQYIPHIALVELARIRGDAGLAMRHAREVAKIAEQTAMPYLRVCAAHADGLARMVRGDFAGAGDALEAGLALAHRSRAGLEYEARMLADLAEARYLAGDNRRALATARAALDISCQRRARVAECRSALVRAAALSAVGEADTEAAGLVARAEHLIAETGVAVLAPLLARLREAARSRAEPASAAPGS
jgi:class 3 adenylate cyclase